VLASKACCCFGACLTRLLLSDAFLQLFGDSVDAHLAQQWCLLLQQPLLFTPTGLRGNVAAFTAAVKATATGNKANTSAAAEAGSGEGCCKDRDVFYYCKPADTRAANRISIGMFHLPGVHLDGPYHTGVKTGRMCLWG
jgi:hypothetical protein